MKKLTFAGIASSVLAALAIGLAAPALASDGGPGTVALPPGGPIAVYPQDSSVGGANPYTPFGTDPYVPFGVWSH
ncbi:hypothetical protein [Mycobacterium sp.]|jgi:hypothetical protein|uniref:hypothetical protein n=1 Tax=Mycobacterium sp. TaxID=1785 RepID=UPI002D4AEC6E|nr:hypothetical protein [Mycobacterium sp.]HZA08432.1 hypothetical protein [Mycobacterium sp.]